MERLDIPTATLDETAFPFSVFGIWSFVLLCRPQDYIPFLGALRPTLTLGLITLFIYLLSTSDKEKLTDSKQFRLYVYFILMLIVSVPFSYYRSASLNSVIVYGSTTAIFFLLFYNFAKTIEKIRKLLFAYCCGVAIYTLYILLYGHPSGDRLYFGTMFDPNDIVYFVISFLSFNFLFIAKDNSGLQRLVAVANLILGLAVIWKTGSRGGMVACTALLGYLMFVKTNTINMSFFKKATLLFIAVIALFSTTIHSERYKTIFDVQEDYNITEETGRIAIWKIGVRLMISHPITGVGMSCFNEGVGRDRERRGLASAKWQSPHNSLVQVGAEIGIFGLILFCLMSFNVFTITGRILAHSRSEKLIKIAEMTRAGFIGHFISAMFLSQAYSVYWAFFIVLSAILQKFYDKEFGEQDISITSVADNRLGKFIC